MLVKERPFMLEGATYKIQMFLRTGEVVVYLTINSNDRNEPYEIGLHCETPEYVEHLSVVRDMGNALLRSSKSIEDVSKILRAVYSPFTGHRSGKDYFESMYSRIGSVLEDHFNK